MFRKNINLLGFRGVGKSSIGMLLHKRLGLAFYDSDDLIERECGSTVGSIFEERGEEFFRDIEASVIKRLCLIEERIILSTGGGSIIRKENRELLEKSGYNILLVARADLIYERIKEDKNRPALKVNLDLLEEITTLLNERATYYNEVKDVVIDTSFAKIDDCVNSIISFIRKAREDI